MRKGLVWAGALVIVSSLADPAEGQVCQQTTTLRSATCPPGQTGCSSKGDTLTHAELDADLKNIINLCNAEIQDWPSPCADGEALLTLAGVLVCGPNGPTTYAGSASEGGPASSVANGAISNAQVASGAAIVESKLSLNFATHSPANDPTGDQKAALAGTNGTPSALNPYVTSSDPAQTNARTPTAHAATHQHGGSDEVAVVAAAANAIPKAGAGGTLASGWIPALSYLPTSTVLPANTTATASQWFTAYDSSTGAFTKARPACADLSNATASCATDATNASNIGTGTLALGRLPTDWPLVTQTVTGAGAISRCARFDASHHLVEASGDCEAGDTGVTGLGATDNVIPRANGTGGNALEGTTVTISDNNDVILPAGRRIGGSDNFVRLYPVATDGSTGFNIGPGNDATSSRIEAAAGSAGGAIIGSWVGTASDPNFTFTSDRDTGAFRAAANVLGLTANGVEQARATANGFGYVRRLTVNTAGSGSPLVLVAADVGEVLTNGGAAAQAFATLPTATAGLAFTFTVVDADGVRITAPGSATIRIGVLVSGAGGHCDSTTIGDSVTLVAVDSAQWVATSVVGGGALGVLGWTCT